MKTYLKWLRYISDSQTNTYFRNSRTLSGAADASRRCSALPGAVRCCGCCAAFLRDGSVVNPPPRVRNKVKGSKKTSLFWSILSLYPLLPLHSTLDETLTVYIIQLETERCQLNFMCIHNRDKRQPAISLGEYINVVDSRIVIGPLDLKQLLPKFKYFCLLLTSARLNPPLSATVIILKPSPLGC